MKANKTSEKRPRRLFATTAAILLACTALISDSRWRLDVEEYELSSARLPDTFDGFRVVHLSDLHRVRFGKDNFRLVEKVQQAKPDIIALTGDFVEGDTDLAEIESLCAQLVQIAPTYFVSGNHDAGSGRLREIGTMMARCGVIYLQNSYRTITKDGKELVICGVEDPNAWAEMPTPDELVSTLRAEHPDAFVLLLGHRNYWPDRYPDLDVDVILSGHGHGGIIRLPFVGGLLGTNANLFPKYDAGVYDTQEYSMVVSRGLGNFPGIPRIFNPPHIPLIVLKSQ